MHAISCVSPVRLKFTLAYILFIPLVGYLLSVVTPVDLGNGTKFTPVSLIAGIVYILRDFAQQEIGRKNIFLAMGIAAAITYAIAHPAIATASLVAFLCGEITDWLVFTFSKRPLSQRVLVSNAIALPIDILVVLTGLQFAMPGFMAFNVANMGIMFVCNMLSALAVFYILRRRENI